MVTIDYTGRPGVHVDGDGSTEGWFRITTAGNEGRFVTTEPVGTESWLPLNNHPSAKPTYDFYDTEHRQDRDRERRARRLHAPVGTTYARARPGVNPPDANFPARLVDVALAFAGADRELPRREQHRLVRPRRAHEPDSGITYYQAQASALTAARRPRTRSAWTSRRTSSTSRSSSTGRTRSRLRDRRRHAGGELRGGDAGEDHLRGRQRRHGRRSGRSTTRTCTSGSATTSPRPRST